MLFGAWHARWAASRVIEDATRRVDATYAKVVLDQWASWPVSHITRMSVQGWVRELEQSGRGPAAVEKAVQQLTSALEAATHDGMVPVNVARRIRLPRRPVQPERILTFEEEDRLLRAMPTAQDHALTVLLLDEGLRYGEAAGLHRHRVDLERRQIQIVEVLTQSGTIKAYPKSDRSQRILPLTERSVRVLADHIEGRAADDLVFRAQRRSPGLDTYGPLIESNWRTRAWNPAVQRAQLALPWPTPHDLRHTALSRLVAEGVDLRSVQEFAGHESLQTTTRYLHALPDTHDRIRAANERIAIRSAYRSVQVQTAV